MSKLLPGNVDLLSLDPADHLTANMICVCIPCQLPILHVYPAYCQKTDQKRPLMCWLRGRLLQVFCYAGILPRFVDPDLVGSGTLSLVRSVSGIIFHYSNFCHNKLRISTICSIFKKAEFVVDYTLIFLEKLKVSCWSLIMSFVWLYLALLF